MLSLLVIGAVALGASALTLISGFGLGTLLLPAFAFFFPVEVAVAATAVVHVLNNIFKLGLLYRHAVPSVLVRFGLPAVAAAFLGALLLTTLSDLDPLATWSLGWIEGVLTPVKTVMGVMILGFAAMELVPRFRRIGAPPRFMPIGGVLSGFFGGLSGHQGALRAAFLRPIGLDPAGFAATQAALATMVDTSRLAVYGVGFFASYVTGVSARSEWVAVGVATACAFAGALVGRRLLPKTTIDRARAVTGALLLLVGAGLATGVL